MLYNNHRLSQLNRQHSVRNVTNTAYLLVGVLLGGFASSFLSLMTASDIVGVAKIHPIIQFQGFTKRSLSSLSDPQPKVASDVGWKQIHVYVGPETERVAQMAQASTINSNYFHSTRWFSQLRQDEVVAQLFRHKRGGYFVDLAANDAVRISNTYALETHYSWTGLAIEPNAIYWPGLSLRKCHVVAAVVGKLTNEKKLFRFPRRAAPQGGLVGPEFDNAEKKISAEEQLRLTVTLQEIFEKFQTPSVIDYLSLDVEGAETFVMESFPFDHYRINALTVERADKKLCDILQAHGYIQLKSLKHWGETLWVHSTFEASMDRRAVDIDTEHYKYREKAQNH